MIAPTFDALADEYAQVTFVKVDIDENQETAAFCGVSSMPTFQFFRSGRLIHTLSGANADALRRAVEEHAPKKAEEAVGGTAAQMEGQAEGGTGSAVSKIVFLEDAGAAIAKARAEAKFLLVFLHGDFDDEAVDQMEVSVWGDPAVIQAACRTPGVVGLQLNAD